VQEEVRPTSTQDAGSAAITNLRPTRAPVAEEFASMTLLEFEAFLHFFSPSIY
jgi:hypothetical protein